MEAILITAFFVGVEAFWVWALLIQEEPPAEQSGEAPDASALRTPALLRQAMVIHGGDPEALHAAERSSRFAVGEFLFWQALVVAGVLGGFWLFTGGNFEEGITAGEMPIWVAMVLVPLVLLVIRMGTGMFARAADAADTRLAGLGLTLTEEPEVGFAANSTGLRPRVGGQAAMAGGRRGRRVQIRDDGRTSRVSVEAASPPFEITSDDGRLRASPGAPPEVERLLRPLRRANRWRGVHLTAGPEAVVVERREHLADGWLYDLWLVESLLAALPAPATA